MDLHQSGSTDSSEISWDTNFSSDEEEQTGYGPDYDSDISMEVDPDEFILDASGFTHVYALGGLVETPTGLRRPQLSDDSAQPGTSRSTRSTRPKRSTCSNQPSTSASHGVPEVSPPGARKFWFVLF